MRVRLDNVIYELGLGTDSSIDPDLRACLVASGTFIGEDGEPLAGFPEKRARQALAGIYDSQPEPGKLGQRRTDPSRQMLIPGLWPVGTTVQINGQPKVGKTTLLVELTAALIIPEHRFLDYFPPANLDCDPQHDGGLDVMLISAEMPPDDLEEALRIAGIRPGEDWLSIQHLRDLGGAQSFDVTNPSLYEFWENRLIECFDPWGVGGCSRPSVVIVDGLTEILAAAGKGVEHYGLWMAAFRRLMNSLDIPNAMVVTHSTYAGDHPMGGVEGAAGADGIWTYSASAAGKRSFLVKERLGSPAVEPLTVELVDGRLTARPRGQRAAQRSNASESEDQAQQADQSIPRSILTFVAGMNGVGVGPSLREIRQNVTGSSSEVDIQVGRLVDDGVLVKKPRTGRGGGDSYFVDRQDAPALGGKDSK